MSIAAATDTAPAGTRDRKADDRLPRIVDTGAVAPADARIMSKSLFDRLRGLEEGTPQYAHARNTLIEMNMSLVHFAARRIGRHDQQEDMIQVGMIGLIKAIDRFDLSRETEFATFAIPTIVGEIKRFFRDTTWAVHVPRRLQEMRVELAKARDTLCGRLGRDPSAAEVAAHLGRTEEEVRHGLVAANAYRTDSLDMPYSGGAPHRAGSLADFIGESDPAIGLVDDLTSLAPLVDELGEREKRLLQMRFGQEMTQAEIGRELGMSQMHVSRLLARTLARLRTGLLAEQ
jgi:RNA polymerase sigma-B factor